jgi:anti-sigma factor RsiW
MTHETLTCQENISADTLSALRDEALPAAEAQRLRAHIPSCAACQARLADFDRVAAALRAQRELDPGDRVLEGVQARIAATARRPLGGRGIWNMGNTWNMRRMTGGRRLVAGLAALAPVAAIILLFVYVFAGIGHKPQVVTTPTAQILTPTPTFFKQIAPTATPALVLVPAFTPAVPAAQAWRGFKPAIDVTFKPNGATEFIPNVFSSDLSTIGGVLFDAANSGPQPAQLAYYTIATGKITKLSPTWHGYTGPWGGMQAMDSRFIVYGFNSQPGGTCGVCNNTLWSLDRATGKTWNFNAGQGGDLLDYVSGDYVAYEPGTSQILVADLAAHTVKVAAPIGAKLATPTAPLGPDERLLGFQWPYLLYAETPAATPLEQPATTLNVLDLATGVNTPITAPMVDQSGRPIDPGSVSNLALVGKTLYGYVTTNLNGVDAQQKAVNMTYGALYRLDDYTANGKFIAVAYWQASDNAYGVDSPTMATRHLVWLGSGYFWDNAELRLVSTSLTNAELIGPDITAIQEQQPGAPLQTFHAFAYDTSGFPVPPGW